MNNPVLDRLIAEDTVGRIWARDPDVFAPARGNDEVTRAILNRLGWLTTPDDMQGVMERVRAFAETARTEGLDHVLLLGMGGSSLCAEVLRDVGGAAPGWPDLVVLDTTDEGAIQRASSQIDPARTIFIVASKSGGTIEVTSLERHFRRLADEALGHDAAGRRFVAITDPDTQLASHAREQGYREIFINPPDIGGRFSALSLFGLVPAALLGHDLENFLASASDAAAGCHENAPTNPGLVLGAFMVAVAEAGRDKLTLLLPPSFKAFGLWVEQLVAESTGKQGVGLIPVTGEPRFEAAQYGADRAFVVVSTDEDQSLEALGAELASAGHPVLPIRTRREHLGADFFRWEFATAVAGAGLSINPFDEPNVKEAKDQTSALLKDRASLDHDRKTRGAPLSTMAADGRPSSPDALAQLLRSIGPGDYCGLLVWLTPEPALEDALQNVRGAITAATGAATTVGIGPRYLHSTGQYHKGGPDTGVFIVITGDDATETDIPGAGYSFATLKRAQALGDLRALAAHQRRVVRLHVSSPGTNAAPLIEEAIRAAAKR
ncbi:MAG: glucose-6-phosphate isomerase [Acidobacteriota bacterium]|nr:glucose-6-phosphate isomerase [Acidobacteriota bacterium]